MKQIIQKAARFSAFLGGIVLTFLALTTALSIIGGSIAKFSYSDWSVANLPELASFIQGTGIRTIPAMYEIMKLGIAFAIFSFLPITSFLRAHAVVDVFSNYFPASFNQFLITFWEIIFFIFLGLITWRLFYGMERMMSSKMTLQELNIPEWYGYLVAFIQMLLASFVTLYMAWKQIVIFCKQVGSLPHRKGVEH